jgi:hypothetical protein
MSEVETQRQKEIQQAEELLFADRKRSVLPKVFFRVISWPIG